MNRLILLLLFFFNLIRGVQSQTINQFPYQQDFENSDGGWSTSSLDSTLISTWQWGMPSKYTITNSHSGLKCWITDSLNPLNYQTHMVLVSPKFDFTNLTKPVISFYINHDFDKVENCGVLDYSENNGLTWTRADTNNIYKQYNNHSNQTTDITAPNWFQSSNGWIKK